ncbi:hybrid sensor histidine kinase/response regulator [Gellertiella hungarica]|uniref:histidine kinase n=1 Tax=Gellertiella hungarica TaxID=1572859 RepID=A0A7W6J2X1_9HYPH|nr:ATP-binding protein [Gellertiella hungarica]MBB4063794.1 signal transduction histidine kinase/CheY-like chemotaxis protein [Gellertiella hungarica]
MSDLQQLRKRLSAAFEVPDHRSKAPHDTLRDPFSLLHDAEEPEPQIRESEAEADPASLSLWMAGAGLLLAAGVLSFGTLETHVAFALAFFAMALLFAVYHIAERLRRSRHVHAVKQIAEAAADREWAAEERKALVSSIHESFGDLAVVRDLKGTIRVANRIFSEVTGEMEPAGSRCEELGFRFEPGSRPGRLVARIATPAGERIFAWGDTIIRHPDTGELLTESVARDITEETRSTADADAARRKAEQVSAAKSRLLATVAHDIRTPLTGLLGMADLLERSKLGPDQRNYVAGLRQSGQVLAYLVEDLLDFATMEAGRFELRPVPESPRNLIEGIVEMLAPRAHFKGLEIASFVAPDVPEYLELDPGRLRQVLFNVVGNAVKFTRRGGVSVSAEIERDDLVIRVGDTGPGMTAAEKARIFEEFIQVGPSRSRSAGKGLGLSISARIVDAFGGSMTVDSEKGVGSTFTIRIPVTSDIRPETRQSRSGLVRNSVALVLVPDGPAGAAIDRTIRALGGECRLCRSGIDVLEALDKGEINGRRITDIIVDHRLEDDFIGPCSERAEKLRLRRIFLVNPEQRQARIAGPYDAWLIRPIREQSLIDVLGGRLRGLEKRGATNDNRPARLPAPTPAGNSRGRIFLGEDDPVNALMIRTALERAGFSVHHAGDFDALMDMLSGSDGWRPDAVLTDLGMPGVADRDVVAELRAQLDATGHQHVPVIVLSGESAEEIRQNALRRGADRFLTKPVPPLDLVNEINAALEGCRKRREG